MMRNELGFLDRLVGGAMLVLLAAGAVYVAVKLIEAVFTALLVIVAVGVVCGLTYVCLKARRERW